MTLPHSNRIMLVRVFLAVAIQFVVAACFYPALKLSRSKRALVLVGLFAPIMLAPLLIQPEARALRLLAAVSAEILCVKLYDVNIGVMRRARPDLRTFLLFLPKWFSLVLRKLNVTSSRNRRKELPGVAKALAGLAAGAVALIAVFEVDWRAQPFAVEHSVKTLAFFFALFSYASVVAGLQRLEGGDIRDPAGTPFLSRTPADFWRRYNRVVQQFCYEDVFRPMGRRLSPVRATLITFALSAIFHEYVFSIAVGRVQGYQTLFFMLQGCAAAATLRIKPRSWAAIGWTAGTFVFSVASSALFFASVNSVGRFYSRGLPPWLADF